MTEALGDPEALRRRLAALIHDQRSWQAELDRRRDTIASRDERLAVARRSYAELQSVNRQLTDQIEALRQHIAAQDRAIEHLFGEATKAHRQLHEVWSSFSWRATIPLRSVSTRLPALARGLRGIGERYPHLWDASISAVRNARRMMVSGSPAVDAAEPPPESAPAATAPAVAPPPADAPAPPRTWLCVGGSHEPLAADLHHASLKSAAPLLPCAWAPAEQRLVPLSPRDAARGFDLDSSESAPAPATGDHLLFTGLALLDADLLAFLNERGIGLSLFVRDADPTDDESHAALLRRVLMHGRCVFVADMAMRDHILRWALLSDIVVSATVSVGLASDYDAVAACITHAATAAPLEQPGRLFIPGITAPELPATLRLAQAWCTEDDPQVSILIVAQSGARLVRACVQQIWANTAGVRYEIILVDHGFGPAECRSLTALGRGVRLLPVGGDRFFGEACNIAAELAHAPLLCLLDQRCFVQPGWLEMLVAAFGADPALGAAGPLLMSPDTTVRDAGGAITEEGLPVFSGKHDQPQPQSVDFVSAAALLIRRSAYRRAGGFDLMYEPTSYEDADLCLKLRTLGLSVRCHPSAQIIQIEPDMDRAAQARQAALGALNRSKFVSRWGSFLRSRSEADLATIKRQIFVDVPAPPAPNPALATAALYTPYAITPGGGERYLLTIAAALTRDHQVTIVTPHPYSQLRLQSIAHTFGIDLSRCVTQTAAEFAVAAAPDLMVVLGNYIYPPIAARTPNAVFICQFPFPMVGHPPRIDRGYRAVIAYSHYAHDHIGAALAAHAMPRWPIDIVYPPVPQVVPDGTPKRPIILTVGRFFTGGHNKRHDLMIEAFRHVLEVAGGEVELHLAGSSTPGPEHMHYLDTLMQAAAGMPVTFHVNASRETLEDLYRRASVYWHATGLGGDVANHPELAEHFGISLVEAMSGGCVPLAFDAGGPREIITQDVDGFLYRSVDDLVTLTADILRPDAATRRQTMGHAAAERARAFAPERFTARVREILLTSAAR